MALRLIIQMIFLNIFIILKCKNSNTMRGILTCHPIKHKMHKDNHMQIQISMVKRSCYGIHEQVVTETK